MMSRPLLLLTLEKSSNSSFPPVLPPVLQHSRSSSQLQLRQSHARTAAATAAAQGSQQCLQLFQKLLLQQQLPTLPHSILPFARTSCPRRQQQQLLLLLQLLLFQQLRQQV
jgi:hypothetical protein